MSFLNDQAPSMAAEFRETYVETMSRILLSVFKAYHTGLMKFYDEAATKTDVIAIEDASLKSNTIFSSARVSNKQTTQYAFSLGERDAILKQDLHHLPPTAAAASPLILHVAQAEGLKCTYEVLFRSLLLHLMNAATSEYLFVIDFFKNTSRSSTTKPPPSTSSPPPPVSATAGATKIRVRELFMRIFARTLSLSLEQLENFLCTCYDAIGLLLMVRLTVLHKAMMAQRRIPVLDAFLDRILLLLWPRIHAILELHLQSVLQAQAKPKKLGNVELHPHYVTRRYAEFVASILTCIDTLSSQSSEYDDDANNTNQNHVLYLHHKDAVLNALASLREALISLLEKLSDGHRNSKDKCVFLINNFDLVVSVVQEKKITSDETAQFETLLARERQTFVEEELVTEFGALILFVQQTETAKSTNVDIAKVEKIVKEFNAHWKQGIEKMNANIMKYFSNFRNGMEILKQVLTQLLLYYTRFIEIIKRGCARPPSCAIDIVTTQEILYEIKKYSRSF